MVKLGHTTVLCGIKAVSRIVYSAQKKYFVLVYLPFGDHIKKVYFVSLLFPKIQPGLEG